MTSSGVNVFLRKKCGLNGAYYTAYQYSASRGYIFAVRAGVRKVGENVASACRVAYQQLFKINFKRFKVSQGERPQ